MTQCLLVILLAVPACLKQKQICPTTKDLLKWQQVSMKDINGDKWYEIITIQQQIRQLDHVRLSLMQKLIQLKKQYSCTYQDGTAHCRERKP